MYIDPYKPTAKNVRTFTVQPVLPNGELPDIYTAYTAETEAWGKDNTRIAYLRKVVSSPTGTKLEQLVPRADLPEAPDAWRFPHDGVIGVWSDEMDMLRFGPATAIAIKVKDRPDGWRIVSSWAAQADEVWPLVYGRRHDVLESADFAAYMSDPMLADGVSRTHVRLAHFNVYTGRYDVEPLNPT